MPDQWRVVGHAPTIEQLFRDLAAVLRTLVPNEPVVLVGHSMGYARAAGDALSSPAGSCRGAGNLPPAREQVGGGGRRGCAGQSNPIETIAGDLPSLLRSTNMRPSTCSRVSGRGDLRHPRPDHPLHAFGGDRGSNPVCRDLVIVPGAGHMVITDDAEMVTDAIEGLLRRVTLVSDYPATECGWPS